jgi:hypothetical protein
MSVVASGSRHAQPMYSAYQSGRFGSSSPVRFSWSPRAAAARLTAPARSLTDSSVVAIKALLLQFSDPEAES